MTDLRAPRLRGCFCCSPSTQSLSTPSRRGFLFGAGALALTAAMGRSGAHAQTADTKPFRIDVHHHLSPPTYVTASNDAGFGDPLMKNWTIEKSLADMDKAGIATAMLSVTTPAVNFTKGDAARKLCRDSNEYGAKLVADHPGRFGNFAMLPLTDVEGSLSELAHALDTLKADGIALMTSYGDKWLGDPLFLPVMEELNRRKALVYTHPTAANCCVNLVPTQPPVMIEFGTDTTRTIADIARDPQYLARGMIVEAPTSDGSTLKVPGVVPKLSATPGRIAHPAPRLGEHDGDLRGAGWPARRVEGVAA